MAGLAIGLNAWKIDAMTGSEKSVVNAVWVHWPLIVAAAEDHGLPADILAGLVCQESQGDTWAARPEPLYRWLFGKKAHHLKRLVKLLPKWRTAEQDFYMQRISFGICQVMGAVAREYNLKGYATRLCDPAVGLEYGALHLANLLRASDGDIDRALQRYNGGGIKDYSKKVRAWAQYFITGQGKG